MKRISPLMMLLTFMIAACAAGSQATQAPADPENDMATPNETAQALGPIEEAVINQLATNLGLKESDISVARTAEAEFKDSCLEVVLQNVICAQVLTPGHILILEAEGIQYEYHTNADGTQIQPATITLTWKREGGIAGFCDYMTVFRSGEVYRSSCIADQYPEELLIDHLSTEEMAQLNNWVMTYGQINIDASDPKGVTDRMVVVVTLSGVGSEQTATSSDRQELLNFAQQLYERFAPISKSFT